MGRWIAFLVMALLSSAARGDAKGVLNSPQQTVVVLAGEMELTAFYTESHNRFEVTALIRDGHGETLRARLPLHEGQVHGLMLEGREDGDEVRFTFRRSRRNVHVEAVAIVEAPLELSARSDGRADLNQIRNRKSIEAR